MLESIKINNFKCLSGSHTVDFREGIYSIKGKKDGDFSRSNRSGKTSFLEAIKFSLFKGQASNLVTYGESDMSTILTINGVELQAGTDGTKVNGDSVLVSELIATSEATLGMDYNMFQCTVAAFSDSLYGFLSLKPKDQKDFLLNYFCDTNVDWASAREYIHEQVVSLTDKRKEYAANITRLEASIKEVNKESYLKKLEDLEYFLANKEHEYSLSKASSETMMESYRSCLIKQSRLTDELQRRETIKDEMASTTTKIKDVDSKIDEISAAISNYVTMPAYDYRIKKLDNSIGSLESTKSQLNISIETYEKSNGKCPILNADCPHTDALNKFYNECIYKAKDVENELTLAEVQLEQSIKDRKEVSKLTSKLKELINLKADLERSLSELKSKNSNISSLVEEFSSVQEEVKFLESSLNTSYIEELLNSINMTKSSISTIKNILMEYDIKQTELERLNGELFMLDSDFKELSVVAKLISPKGLPHLLLSSVLDTLENYTNKFLKFVGMSVYISGYAELKSLEDYCQNDGTKFGKTDSVCRTCGAIRENKVDENISVISKDSGVEWYRESSGGRALIALATRLALFKLAKSKKAEADFLILDEVFTNLDSDNKQNALKMLKFAMQDLDLKQIFLVSHDEIKDCTDNELVVSHSNGKVSIE